ncbi:hypothetical protein H0H93_005010 [Arthromyces matolae]|nr:hypothetical protein H0H93_005010 [Arthromyces matolae]
MSASARAEARRKAILSRGSDRLAKLTTSARGDDPAYMHPDPPLPTLPVPSRNFVGEESLMPTPPPRPSPSPRRTSAQQQPINPFAALDSDNVPDPSVWSEQQQQQLLQALLAGTRSPESLPGLTPIDVDPSLPPMDNPIAAMLFPKGPNGDGAFPSFSPSAALGKSPAAPAPPTRIQKLMPFVHLLSTWALLAYFVLYLEPKTYLAGLGNFVDLGGQQSGIWKRWAELGRASGIDNVVLLLKVSIVDAVQPPMLLSLALPHLPPPLPSIITNALKYLQMGFLFLDDLAGVLVGLGFIVMLSGWFAS